MKTLISLSALLMACSACAMPNINDSRYASSFSYTFSGKADQQMTVRTNSKGEKIVLCELVNSKGEHLETRNAYLKQNDSSFDLTFYTFTATGEQIATINCK